MLTHRISRRMFAVAAATGLAAVLAGCATTETPSATPSSTGAATYPVTVGSATLAAAPKKIVSLSPTATEMLFAIGAGAQVVAVDTNSNFPAGVPKSDLSGFQPNAEAIAAKNPDLVVLSNDSNNVVAQLAALKIPVYLAAAAVTLDDSYKQVTELGALTDHGNESAAVAKQMKDDIAKLVKDLPKRDKPLTYYYELDPTYYSVTSKTFIGSLFTLAGLTNVADAADTKGSGYPQLGAEALVKSNPDMIFLADTKCCGQSADSVKKRAGWAAITAVSKGQVVALDDDVASRWGPRVVDLVRAIVEAVNKVPA